MSYDLESLYSLLPEIYRIRDREQGGQLKALLSVIADQVAVFEEDLAQLYDDQFIETCAKWAMPYIGDLIGFRGLKTPTGTTVSQRAEVANCLSSRKRKGTFSNIKQIVADTTGWDCEVVEYFRLLAMTQNMKHLRQKNVSLIDLRPWQYLLDVNMHLGRTGAYDKIPHNLDIRSIDRQKGLYNIHNIGIFIWRLEAQRLSDSPAFKVDDQRYTFSPLGNDVQLFRSPKESVPMPLTRSILLSILQEPSVVPDLSLKVNGIEIYPQGVVGQAQLKVVACDLSDMQSGTRVGIAWLNTPVPEGIVAIDPVLGRIAFSQSFTPESIRTTFYYGFSADMGGGEYFTEEIPEGVKKIDVSKKNPQLTLNDAILALGSTGGVVVIRDNERYEIGNLAIDASNGKRIEIRAEEGCRPILDLLEEMIIDGYNGEVYLRGLIISGSTIRAATGLKSLTISHCTLVPGLRPGRRITDLPSLLVFDDGSGFGIEVEIAKSIVGPLRLPAFGADLVITDSIIDSPTRGRGARICPALVSGNKDYQLADAIVLRRLSLSFKITIAGQGPYKVSLLKRPKDLKEARVMLERAIRSAYDSPGFMGARVIAVNDALAIVPGVPGEVLIASSRNDLASWLMLGSASAKRTVALVGGTITIPIKLSSNDPALTVSLDGHKWYHLKIGSLSSLEEMANGLQSSLSAYKQLKGLTVSSHEDRLIVLSSNEELTPSFGPSEPNSSSGDYTTYKELGLQLDVPAISDAKAATGPELTIERSTVQGIVRTRKLSLASECIFADLLLVDQRQEGCLRFSYVPRGSKTHRRYECLEDNWPEGLIFTSTVYGNPGYFQLSQLCSAEIRQGNEGGELGAFHDLYQPQRETNMKLRLLENMRFCLDYGIFYST